MPLPPTGVSEENVGVLSAVQYGEPFRLKARTFSKVFALSI